MRLFEVGLKGRASTWRYDTSVYYIRGTDEIVSTVVDGQTTYQNAGKTDKRGFEFAGSRQIMKPSDKSELWLGLSYTYSNYKYDQYTEVIKGVSYDRSGNDLYYVPKQQYSVFATWEHTSGWKARLQSDSWGEYYLDSANSEKFGGYDFITSLNIAYDTGPHSISANIQNLTDKRYAVEVKKDANTSNKSYTPGAPRSILVSYQYQFE